MIKENGFILKKARSRWYPTKSIMNANNADETVFLANISAQVKSLQPEAGSRRHWSLWEWKQNRVHVFLSRRSHLHSKWQSSEISRQIHVPQQQCLFYWKWCQYLPSEVTDCYLLAINHIEVSDQSDKIKWNFFQAVVVSILFTGCTIWMLPKKEEKKLDGNCTRILWVILNKSRETTTVQPPTSHH